MDKRLHIHPYRIFNMLLMIIFMTIFTACSIYDDEDSCPTGFHIRFKYDYNMKYADAFSNEVDKVTVYVFDEQGEYIMQQSEEGAPLKDKDYYMTLDLQPGNYHLITWAGLTGTSFELVEEGLRQSYNLTQLKVKLITAGGISDSDLHPLWHGEKENLTVTESGYEETVISLTKDTNRIRLVMQQQTGADITDTDFSFEITDDNSLLDYNNSVIPNGTITYEPYASGYGTVGDVTITNFVYYEAHTSRLMENSAARLRVTRTSDGEVVVDIPLIQYLMLTEMEGHKESMSAQEYLDRQDEYSLVFFLDNNLSWLQTQIIVNGWTIRFNNGQLE